MPLHRCSPYSLFPIFIWKWSVRGKWSPFHNKALNTITWVSGLIRCWNLVHGSQMRKRSYFFPWWIRNYGNKSHLFWFLLFTPYSSQFCNKVFSDIKKLRVKYKIRTSCNTTHLGFYHFTSETHFSNGTMNKGHSYTLATSFCFTWYELHFALRVLEENVNNFKP